MMTMMAFFPMLMMLFGPFGINAPMDSPTAEQARARYELLASRLQSGGDVYIVKNSEGRLSAMVGAIGELAQAGDAETAAVFASLDGLLRDQGFYSLLGMGYSSLPREDGLKDIRLFLARDADAANLGVWRLLLAGAPDQLALPDYLPATTSLALAVSPDGMAFWQIWSQVNVLLANQGDIEAAVRDMENMTRQLGANPADLLASLGDELIVSIQLATDGATVSVPMGETSMAIPQPSLLLLAKVNDERLLEFVVDKLRMGGGEVTTSDAHGVSIRSMANPLPAPVPVQPAVAMVGNTLVVGSTPAVVAEALAAGKAGGGLVKNAAFRELFGDAKISANAWFYGDPRIPELFRKGVEQATANQGDDMPNFAALLGRMPSGATGWTMVNMSDGVLMAGRGTGALGEYLLQGTPLQLVMMAGMVMPAMGQSRNRARDVACMANLRQIENAKQAWCLENNMAADAVPTAADLEPFLPTGGFAGLRCPAGGIYSINAVDQPVTCSHPRHRLPR